jgi:hypothetical protein
MKWMPNDWIARKPTDRHNNLLLKHSNSTIEFRHIRQEGKAKGEEQSNLLSATYDAIFVDQLDDPEFSYKDLADLIGRLRGTAQYIGDDPTMPDTGPQWFRFGANPTRNWLYREVVSPFFTWKRTGFSTRKLMIDEDTKLPIVEVFNAPSSANQKHTGKQYVSRMRAVYRGTMAKRFIDADWSAYEGLVYPDYDETVHMVDHEHIIAHVNEALLSDSVGVVEGYDYGQVSPSCYLLAFYDDSGNVFIVDGFYEPLETVEKQAKAIKTIRNSHGIVPTDHIYADPDIFKGKNATSTRVGESIANMFRDNGIEVQRGANAVESGIDKISSYLANDDMHMNPIKRQYGAPRLYVSSKLDFWHNEIADYYWNKNVAGERVDRPRDYNDHAMDATKYLFTRRGRVVGGLRKVLRPLDPRVRQWAEIENNTSRRLPRYQQ